MRVFSIAVALWMAAAGPSAGQAGMDLLKEGMTRLGQGELDAAQRAFEQAVDRGRAQGNVRLEGGGLFGLGKVFLAKSDYAAARQVLERALPLQREGGDRLYIGYVLVDLGFVEWATGNHQKAEPLYLEALGHFESIGNRREQASALYNLAFTMPPGPEQLAVLQQGLDATRALGDRRLEGLLLHRWGDQFFTEGDLVAAGEKLDQAAALLQGAGARRELARVHTSLGRLYRFHGDYPRAVAFYQQALATQTELNDRQGAIQSQDALGIAWQASGDLKEAESRYDQALALARVLKAPHVIGRQLVHLASLHVDLQEYARAAELLEEASALNPRSSGHFEQLSAAYLGLGRGEEALAAAETAVSIASAATGRPSPEALAQALYQRARARHWLGRQADALADARESVQAIERLRAHLVANDDLRREFTAQHRVRFDFLIELLYRAGEFGQALEVAEQGRARAFLDLLATRDVKPSRTVGAELKALVSAPPASLDEIVAAATRLESTLLSYWVGGGATYVWVVAPGEAVRAARLDLGSERLEKLVPSQFDGERERTLTTRGEGTVAVAVRPAADWRRLYHLLVAPVRKWLPTRPGSRLTVVPHGPLHRLSFAAMQDAKGQYLLERHALHYVPSAALLQFTAKRKEAAAARPARYLLVADPSSLPPAPDGRPLARLPGTRLEVNAIARRVPAGSVTVLTGEQASEEAVRAQAPGKTVIHLATHGFVRDEQPFESFLALAGRGRLTAQKIYGLDLSADLVVLSACRSGLGRLSGDGIVGLTRAFFYAGTPSIVATLWDVADEPTFRLVSGFYQALGRQRDKAGALRSAQLSLLRALRRGEVRVQTPLGEVILPENPVFWAGFVLQGEI